MNIPFIKYSRIWYAIVIITMILAIGATMKWGLRLGIDFKGGSLLEMSFTSARPELNVVQNVLENDLKVKNSVIQKAGDNKYIVRTEFLSEDEHQAIIKGLRDKLQSNDNKLVEDRFEAIGPAISQQLRQRAILSIVFVSIGIIAYVAYAFRKVSRPVASWKYGAMAIVAQLHDIMLVIGVFAVLGHYLGIEVGLDFVVALLTVLGYSVTDTIVVYDRIRENLLRHGSGDFSQVVNDGLNQTMMRSINTTATIVLPLLALFLLGGMSIKYFALALLIGMVSGAYSSIFIASPLLALVEKRQRQNA